MFLMLMLTAVFTAGCKKDVGTPEDNAVVAAEEDEESEGEEETGYVLGYSCINLTNPFYDTLKTAIQTSLEEEGATLIVKNPEGDVNVQISQIEEMIEEGVDAVFLSPADWEEITPALEALKEADIPVINLDTQVKETDLIEAFIGSDNKNAGYVCGEDLLAQRPDGGKILIVESSGINSVNERITGFEEAIANGGFEVLDRISEDSGDVREAMAAALARFPEIDAVMCGNDQMAEKVYQAVKEAGRTDILIYGVDGSPEIKKLLAAGENAMAGTGAQSPIHMGKTAAETALSILNGEDYEEEVCVDTFFINRDNVEMYGTDGWQ